MVHGCHFDLRFFQRSKTTLNDHEPLIAAGSIFQGDGIVIGLNDPFAIIFCGLPDLSAIYSNAIGFGHRQVFFEAL